MSEHQHPGVWVRAENPRGPRTLLPAHGITRTRTRHDPEETSRFVLEVRTDDGEWHHMAQGSSQTFEKEGPALFMEQVAKASAQGARHGDPGAIVTALDEQPHPRTGKASFTTEVRWMMADSRE